jgi:hypothetical protein
VDRAIALLNQRHCLCETQLLHRKPLYTRHRVLGIGCWVSGKVGVQRSVVSDQLRDAVNRFNNCPRPGKRNLMPGMPQNGQV